MLSFALLHLEFTRECLEFPAELGQLLHILPVEHHCDGDDEYAEYRCAANNDDFHGTNAGTRFGRYFRRRARFVR